MEKDEPSGLAGRRTLGPTRGPGGRYSLLVGLAFLAVIGIAFVNLITSRNTGTLGLEKVTSRLPLPEFAVPVADSDLEGDANIAQDDCETSDLPCPPGSRRTPACRVRGADVIRVCDFFDRPFVLSFWFTRGGDCEAQQDVVSDVYRRYRGRVNFLSLDVRDDRDTVRDLVRGRGWKMPVGYDHDGAASNLYRVGGCPTFVYAFPGGILESTSVGQLTDGERAAHVRDLVRASRAQAATSR
jgi:hypothetical protein